ncbi:putative HEAT protein, partial [Trichinella spiralis]|uniref:putative HEAT protein n=1 Tax=Trichinella spiralis TaxID=6334 RepID=UPI0001EFE231
MSPNSFFEKICYRLEILKAEQKFTKIVSDNISYSTSVMRRHSERFEMSFIFLLTTNNGCGNERGRVSTSSRRTGPSVGIAEAVSDQRHCRPARSSEEVGRVEEDSDVFLLFVVRVDQNDRRAAGDPLVGRSDIKKQYPRRLVDLHRRGETLRESRMRARVGRKQSNGSHYGRRGHCEHPESGEYTRLAGSCGQIARPAPQRPGSGRGRRVQCGAENMRRQRLLPGRGPRIRAAHLDAGSGGAAVAPERESSPDVLAVGELFPRHTESIFGPLHRRPFSGSPVQLHERFGTVHSRLPVSGVVVALQFVLQQADQLHALFLWPATYCTACEFWLTLAEEPANCREVVRPYLAELIPVLVRRMRYSEQDLRNMKADLECDELIPDRAEDIQPRFRRSKPQQQQQDANSMSNVDDGINNIHSSNVDANDHNNNDDDDDDDSVSGCDFSVDASSEWNVRKGSAATLDVLSNVFRDELLPHLLPILDGDLFQQDWLVKEAAILALGAVAEGCANGMAPHLPTLVPYLIGCLNDSKALVRSITCWTLSRYGHWILQFPNERHFEQLLKELLGRLLDVNKRVQEAACSAFATLEEEANFELVPYLNEVVQTLCAAFEKYQAKNLLILYDAVGTLAESIGTCLAKPELVDALMPPLMAKWNRTDDTERERYSLLECMASVVVALQDNFLPYSTSVFSRCVHLISCNVETATADLMLGSGSGSGSDTSSRSRRPRVSSRRSGFRD